MRGQGRASVTILDQIERGANIAVVATVPLSAMFGYIGQLRSMTSGRASFTMEFSHYDPVPKNVADEVIAEVAKRELRRTHGRVRDRALALSSRKPTVDKGRVRNHLPFFVLPFPHQVAPTKISPPEDCPSRYSGQDRGMGLRVGSKGAIHGDARLAVS